MKKSQIYKISFGVGAAAAVAVPTLAVVYGTKNWKYHDPRRNAQTKTEEFFDSEIASSKSTYLTEKIMNPNGGSDLSSSFISLDQKWMDYKHIQDMIEKDENGNNIKLGQIIANQLGGKQAIVEKFGINKNVIDKLVETNEINVLTKDYVNPAALEAELLKVNQLLNEYNAAANRNNQARRVGIYISPDLNQRSIIIQLFQLKEFNDQDKNLITQFTNKINLPNSEADPMVQEYYKTFLARQDGTKVVNGDYGPDKEWIQLFGSEHFLQAPYHLSNWYHLDNSRTALMAKLGIDKQESIRIIDDNNPWEGSDVTSPVVAKNRILNYDGEIYGLRSFYNQNMMITHKPIVDLVSGKFKIVFTFYKFDENSSFVGGLQHKVLNPTNVYTVTKSMNLSLLGDQEKEIDKTDANRDLLRKMLTDHDENTFQKWFDQPLTKPGLEILGSVMPALKSPVSKMIQLFKEVDYLQKNKEDFKSKILSDSNIDNLFDRLKNNSSFNAQEFWKVSFIDFPNELMTFWNSINQLTHMDKSGIFKLYNLTTGMYEVSKWLDEVIKTEYPNFEFPDSDSSAISTLLFLLKKNYVVPQSFTVEDIINEPKKSIITILEGLNDHKIALDPEYSKIILELVSQYIPSIKSENLKNIETPLEELLGKQDGIQSLVKLILGDHKADEVVDVIFKGNYLKIVEFIATNKHVDSQLIRLIAKIAAASGFIPTTFMSLLPDTEQSSQMIANIFNKGAMADIFSGVEHVLDDGIGGIDEARFERLIESFRDSVENQHTVNLLDVFANVKSPFEILPIVSKLEIDVASLSTWGGVKTLLADVEKLLNPSTTIKFGNTGKTIYQVVDHLKQLVDASKIADDSSLTDAITSLMLDTANSQKILETLIGIAIYAGSDSVDKTNDQLFPIVGTLIGSFVSKINWNAEPIKGMLPMALDLIIHGTDYDMKSGTIWEDAHPDKVDNINKFIDHIFAQAKEAGFNIDAYRSETHDGMDWLSNLFDGSVDANGKSTIEKLIENIHAGNPVADISSYVTNDLITFVVKQLMGPLQHGLISSSTNTQAGISEDTIKNLLNLVKNFAPSLSSVDVDTVSKLVNSVLTNGVAGLSDDDWNKIIPMITGILPDSIKNFVTPELVKNILFGFKSIDDVKAVLDKISPSIWTTNIDKNIVLDHIKINVSEIVTNIYNGHFDKDVTVLGKTILTKDLNALSSLLQKGVMHMSKQEVDATINAVKSEISALNSDLGLLGLASGIVDALKEVTPMLKDIVPKLHAFGTELNQVVGVAQKLIVSGAGALDVTDINNIISGAKKFIENLKPIIPDLAKNEMIAKVQSVLSLLENKGQAVYNLLHNGFSGTTPENIGKSEVIVSILKEFVSLPSMIVDYIPKIIVGQGNIDNVRTEVSKEISALVIPVEAHADDGVIIPTNIGKYSDMDIEASRLANIATDATKPVSDVLDALAKYKMQLLVIDKYNFAIAKLNADYLQLKTAKDVLQAEHDKWSASQQVSLTLSKQVAHVQNQHLTTAIATEFGLNIALDETKYSYLYSVDAIPTDGTYHLTVSITSKDSVLVAAKAQAAQPITINLVVTGIEAAKQAEQAKLVQLAHEAANAPTFIGTAAGSRISSVNAHSFNIPTIAGYTLEFKKVDASASADKTEGDAIFELKSTAFTSLPAQEIRVHISGFDVSHAPTPSEFATELKTRLEAAGIKGHIDQSHLSAAQGIFVSYLSSLGVQNPETMKNVISTYGSFLGILVKSGMVTDVTKLSTSATTYLAWFNELKSNMSTKPSDLSPAQAFATAMDSL